MFAPSAPFSFECTLARTRTHLLCRGSFRKGRDEKKENWSKQGGRDGDEQNNTETPSRFCAARSAETPRSFFQLFSRNLKFKKIWMEYKNEIDASSFIFWPSSFVAAHTLARHSLSLLISHTHRRLHPNGVDSARETSAVSLVFFQYVLPSSGERQERKAKSKKKNGHHH